MAKVDVAHIEAGTFTAQTTRPEGAQTALVGQLSQRIGLIHKLAQLAATKEFARRRHHGADVDQAQRRDLVWVADRHAFAHDALHAQEANAQLVLDQLAHGLDTAVAQVIDVVLAAIAIIDLHNAPDHRHQILVGQNAVLQRCGDIQTAIDFVATHFAQVIAPGGKEEILDKALGIVQGRRVAGA